MKENISEIKVIISTIIDLNYLPVIRGNLKEQSKFIEQCKLEFNRLQKTANTLSPGQTPAFLENVIQINAGIKKLLSSHFKRDEKDSFKRYFPDLVNSLDKFLSESPETVIEIQDNERFLSNVNDKLHIKLRKPVKKLFLNISNLPVTIANYFRKIFKKPVKEKNIWKRTVQLRKLRQHYLYYNLSSKLLENTRKYYQHRSSAMNNLWKIHELIENNINDWLFSAQTEQKTLNSDLDISSEFRQIDKKLSDFENSLNAEIQDILEQIFSEYQDKYLKAGTIEYPERKLRKGILKKNEKRLNNLFTLIFHGWENNIIALGDDWQMNNELYLLKYNTSVQHSKYLKQFQTSVETRILPNSDKIISVVKELKESLELPGDGEDLLKTYSGVKTRIKNELTNDLIPGFINSLLDQNLSGIVAEFDNIIQEQIDSIKHNRLLVKTDEYDTEIKNSEINSFSPKEILEYSAAPKFFNATNKLKNYINNQVQQVQNDLSETDHITEFTIDSAINKLEFDHDIEESRIVALEGTNRAINKLSGTNKKFNEILERFNNEINAASDDFFTELKNLTLTEKIFDIRLNLAKAKAIQRSKQLRKQFVENAKNIIPKIVGLIKKLFLMIRDQYQKVRGLFGLAPGAKVIASEISDYLAETQSAVLKLPYVYQRLFEVKALDDKRFFFGRETELQELGKAIANWKKEKFAPTIIIGEKGSGSTSLINNFLTSGKSDFEIIRYSVIHPVSDCDHFLKILSEMFNTNNLNSFNDVISYLNNDQGKKIIVIENLQRMFLRKVEGFKVLKMFFEIISKTNKNNFWLSTCTLYSWLYLDKTIHAPDYFGYVIYLKKLNEDQITDLVSKRHRVSGYNISYEADESTLKSKTYKKIPEEERQSFLRKKYFAELNKFAQSNISLALLFWLRSAREIVNDIIKIGSPPDLDYSFLENLSNDKVFALSALLIHDGLTINDHAEIFNVPENRSNLLFQLMHDDGIIVKHNNLYIINPLLYRQIVGLLKSKNIIY